MPDINYKLEAKKEVLSENKRELLFINITYPVFESEKQKELCKNLTEYYEKGTEAFLKFCRERLFEGLKREENKYKCGIVMNAKVSYLDEKYLSVITDISYFDGKTRRTRRLHDNFRFCGEYPLTLRARHFLPLTKRAKRLYTDEICSKIISGDGGFCYNGDAVKTAKRHFDAERFYLTPKGVAFYYEKGTILPEKDGEATFVIPYFAFENI